MMRDLPPIYVLRHGQTEWNAVGRFQGHLDAPLTATGLVQARQQGVILRGQVLPDLADAPDIRVSPLGRARATWAMAAGAAGLDLEHGVSDQRLAEVYMGDWQGRTRDDLDARDAIARSMPNVFELSLSAPGGEDFDALHQRVADLLTALDRPTICVTHGMTALMLRGLVRGLSRGDMAGQGHQQGVIFMLRDGQETVLELPGATSQATASDNPQNPLAQPGHGRVSPAASGR